MGTRLFDIYITYTPPKFAFEIEPDQFINPLLGFFLYIWIIFVINTQPLLKKGRDWRMGRGTCHSEKKFVWRLTERICEQIR